MSPQSGDKYKYFRLESAELIENLTRELLELRKDPHNIETVKALFRYAHTLKGAASVVGINSISQLFHKMEDWLSDFLSGKMEPDERAIIFLIEISDTARSLLKRLLASENAEDIDVGALLDIIERAHKEGDYGPLAETEETQSKEKQDVKSDPGESEVKTPIDETISQKPVILPEEAIDSGTTALSTDSFSSEYLKISLGELDEMTRYSNEIIINILRLRNSIDQVRSFQKEIITQNTSSINSFTSIAESQSKLDSVLEELELGIEQTGLFSQELNDTIMDLRLVSVDQAGYLFEKVVYTMAAQYNKKLTFVLEGGAILVDRTLLENIKEPISHILRNAVIHGVEDGEEREKSGKPVEAVIKLNFQKSDKAILVTCEDDGAGMDIEKIKQKAIQKGFLTITNAADISDEDVVDFIFYPGFSTSEAVSEFAGRGVGMEVVKDGIMRLGGHLSVLSEKGKFTRFTMNLPFSINMTDAFMVTVSNQKLLFPFRDIVGIREAAPGDFSQEAGKMVLAFDETPIAVAYLSDILSIPQKETIETKSKRVVIFKNRETCFGLLVDHFIGARKILLKQPVGELQKIPHIESLTILETGDPAFVIDISGLFDSFDSFEGRHRVERKKELQKAVLIVDDSLTTRSMLKDILEDEGLAVTVACSAAEAMVRLGERRFNLIITDVEMPEMDGFELCRIIRENSEWKTTPIIIMSSMGSDEDIAKGMESGADAYIVKGSFNYDSFLESIRRTLA